MHEKNYSIEKRLVLCFEIFIAVAYFRYLDFKQNICSPCFAKIADPVAEKSLKQN